MQTAIYYGIKHFGYLACYIAKNKLYTTLYTMLYSIVYNLKRVLGLLNAMLYSDFRLYSMVYSLLGGPWVVKKPFFFGYIGCFLAIYHLP